MNIFLTMSNILFPMVTLPYVSRILGVTGLGTVQFAIANMNYFINLAMLGIPVYGIRACASVRSQPDKLKQTVQEIAVINTISTTISFVLLVILVGTVPVLRTEATLYWVLSASMILNVIGVEWFYKAIEEYSYITIRSLIGKIVAIILMLTLVRQTEDYVIYAGLTVLASVGFNVFNFVRLFSILQGPAYPLSTLNLKRHLLPVMLFFLMSLSVTIYSNLDTTMLGFFKGANEVGIYSLAVKIKSLLVAFVTSIGTVLLPRLSVYHSERQEVAFKQLVGKALHFVLLLALPLVVYFILNAKQIVLFISGEVFLSASWPVALIMPSVVFIGLSNITGIQVLVPMNCEQFVVYSTMIGAVVNVIVNAILIRSLGSHGTAIANVISEGFVLLVQIWYLKDLILPLLKQIPYTKIVFALIAGMACYGVVYLIGNGNFFASLSNDSLKLLLNMIISFGALIAGYGASLLILKDRLVINTLNGMMKGK